MKAGGSGFAKPTALCSVGDSYDLGTPLSEPGELGRAISDSDGAIRKICGHNEEVDEGKDLDMLFIVAMGTAVEGNEAPRFANDVRRLPAGGPVAPVEMQNAAGFEQVSRKIVHGKRREVAFFE